MKLHFTKCGGKYDQLKIERADGSSETISCPKQRIIPHDMVHYGVESVLEHRGFLSMVAGGDRLEFETVGGVSEEAVERLVEAFQSALWSGGGDAADIRYAYLTACEARGHAALQVSDEHIHEISARLGELSEAWEAIGEGETLSLTL